MQIMPFEEAKTYRFNPFDLTKVWPHGDYPLHEVGRLTLDRNPTDFHTEIEQAAFEPNNLVPGIGPSPDKMLLGRIFAYADAHRPAWGSTTSRSRSTSQRCRCTATARTGLCGSRTCPTLCTRRTQRAAQRPTANAIPEVAMWEASGDFVRAAYTMRKDDDDFGQAGTLVRKVMDDAQRDRLVSNVVGHLKDGVSEPVLQRAFEYWRNIDKRSATASPRA